MPAVGTGSLNFPVDVVADCMLSECEEFSARHPESQTTLTEVRLVVLHTDHSTFDVRCLSVSVIELLKLYRHFMGVKYAHKSGFNTA